MIDTRDLDSYYPGYDEYCEIKESQGDEDIDAIIDEKKLQELEEKKETELFRIVYSQGVNSNKFDVVTYHTRFLERICKQDPSMYLAIKNTVKSAFENIEQKVKEEEK